MAYLAVVGCGQWGSHIIRNLSHLHLLGAVSDENNERARFFADRHGVEAMTWSDLLQSPSIQGLIIALPASLHETFALEALRHGKHVWIEKPVAFSTHGIERLRIMAETHGKILMAGHLLRYHPAFIALENYVKEGHLGQLLSIETTRKSFGRLVQEEQNVFWSLACHDVSLILALAGQGNFPDKIFVQGESPHTSLDHGSAFLSFPSGLKAHLHASWLFPHKEQKLFIRGTQGWLLWSQAPEKYLRFYPYFLSSHGLVKEGEPYDLSHDETEPLETECLHFWHSVTSKTPPLTDVHECLGVTKVLQEMNEALLSFSSYSSKNELPKIA